MSRRNVLFDGQLRVKLPHATRTDGIDWHNGRLEESENNCTS
jgi:hypothetical protein